ncbi:bidirectional sugar transporter SWEET4-like [Curcuma longa]|uniref:bidirectional sugar transporter SWEET4-like n=1 Tax=Curcuma longa TaxID=136217 RepID=UPI003D9E7E09
MPPSADTARTAIGIVGNVTSLVLFLSPAPTIYSIYVRRSVEQFSAVPYHCAMLNCMLWVLYGLPEVHPHSTLVLTINGAGFLIELAYVLVLLSFSTGGARLRALATLVGEFLFVGSIAAFLLAALHGDIRRLVAGVLCVVFGTAMYAAPLSVMRQVIHTRSVEFMPLSLSAASFINSFCWSIYATIRDLDHFILIPNALGVAFAAVQLVLHWMYGRGGQLREGEGGDVEMESGNGSLEQRNVPVNISVNDDSDERSQTSILFRIELWKTCDGKD